MHLTDKQFDEYLALYGPKLTAWPEALRVHVLRAQASPRRMAKVIEAQYVEEVLFAYRPVEEPSADFAARIVRTARATRQVTKVSVFANLRAALEYLVPHPAAAFASVLVLGLVIGMSIPAVSSLNTTSENSLHTDLDDKGAIL